ncbi:hypothetical protein ABAC460_20590 [Asticcacaulis sp. AC460]|uniref:tetratricopeptide repeat protein n=1 Tax=Asticcacaulis sp. AC460 TaxID=1282360 RepID=UPI0003C3B804|nr:SEL1-like repeat protein [Asticcacaulis sp. AC460]ESQ87172.1 hypothetical protein ABAC460_20590 [Asticcacaulis sp. AC460]
MKKLFLAASLLAMLVAVPAHAEWSAANDEANRQRIMSSMRQQDAYNDRASFERSMQANRYTGSSTSSSTSSSSGSSASPYTGSAPGTSVPVDNGPQSVVATRTFVIYKQETEAQTIARIRKEAEAGEMLSQFNLGRIYYTGYGVTRDDAQARKWFGAAAKQGHIPSMAQYGMMLVNAQGGPADRAGGMTYLKQAADKGDSYAQALWGFFEFDDHKADENPQIDDAIAMLETAADQGELIAQLTLGRIIYYLGVGATVDQVKAAKYLRLAVDQGDTSAMGDLGEYYMAGLGGVEKDTTEGLRLIKASADGGNHRAQYLYGLMLLQGQLVAKDEATGQRYMKMAAEGGNVEAEYLYGDCLYFGLGTEKNVVESARWYQRAANHGHTQSIEIMKEPEMIEAAKQL